MLLHDNTTNESHLVGAKHVLVEDVHGNLVDQRVGNPCSVMSSGDFAQLISPDLLHSNLVGLGVIFDGNLSRHSTHSSNLSPIQSAFSTRKS